jgi:hypothetical protein
MREVRRRCPRPLRLHLSDIDFTANAPCDTTYHKIDEHGHDDNPTSGARVGVDAPRGVENADEEHGETHADSSRDHVRPPAPFIGEDGRWDGDGYDYDGGYARGEKAGFVAANAGLLEDERCVLLYGSAYVCARTGFPFPFDNCFLARTRSFVSFSIVVGFFFFFVDTSKITSINRRLSTELYRRFWSDDSVVLSIIKQSN